MKFSLAQGKHTVPLAKSLPGRNLWDSKGWNVLIIYFNFTYNSIKSWQIPAQECVSLFLAEFVAVLCGSMMLANIPQKKKHIHHDPMIRQRRARERHQHFPGRMATAGGGACKFASLFRDALRVPWSSLVYLGL
jgi:hypothetical protein